MSARDARTSYRRRAAETERSVDAAVAEVKSARLEKWDAARARAAAAERDRRRFTREEIVGVTHVRDRFGWHKVVAVNAKTVTVETGHSWTARIALDAIVEHRTVTA